LSTCSNGCARKSATKERQLAWKIAGERWTDIDTLQVVTVIDLDHAPGYMLLNNRQARRRRSRARSVPRRYRGITQWLIDEDELVEASITLKIEGQVNRTAIFGEIGTEKPCD
jgi:hypothetical protein